MLKYNRQIFLAFIIVSALLITNFLLFIPVETINADTSENFNFEVTNVAYNDLISGHAPVTDTIPTLSFEVDNGFPGNIEILDIQWSSDCDTSNIELKTCEWYVIVYLAKVGPLTPAIATANYGFYAYTDSFYTAGPFPQCEDDVCE